MTIIPLAIINCTVVELLLQVFALVYVFYGGKDCITTPKFLSIGNNVIPPQLCDARPSTRNTREELGCIMSFAKSTYCMTFRLVITVYTKTENCHTHTVLAGKSQTVHY
jgi:hypothetical protein